MSAITSPEADTESQGGIGGCLADKKQAAQNATPMGLSRCTDQVNVTGEHEIEHFPTTGQAPPPTNTTNHANGVKIGLAVISAPNSPDNEGIE